MVKLISLDLDGTLLNRDRHVPERNFKALKKASENGIQVIISTGSPYGLMPHKELQGMGISYAITANGSAIYEYETGKCIYEKAIATEEIIPILEFLLTKDMHMDMFMGGKAYCPANTRQTVEKLAVPQSRKDYILKNHRMWLEDVIPYIREHQLTMQKITMNFYPGEDGEMVDREEVRKFLESRSDLKLVSGGWQNLEITRADANKGDALRFLCEHIDIAIEDTVAIGDSLNDLDIIQAAGTGVAMKNSMPVLLEAADAVTGSNDECGVAEYVEGVLKNAGLD